MPAWVEQLKADPAHRLDALAVRHHRAGSHRHAGTRHSPALVASTPAPRTGAKHRGGRTRSSTDGPKSVPVSVHPSSHSHSTVTTKRSSNGGTTTTRTTTTRTTSRNGTTRTSSSTHSTTKNPGTHPTTEQAGEQARSEADVDHELAGQHPGGHHHYQLTDADPQPVFRRPR